MNASEIHVICRNKKCCSFRSESDSNIHYEFYKACIFKEGERCMNAKSIVSAITEELKKSGYEVKKI